MKKIKLKGLRNAWLSPTGRWYSSHPLEYREALQSFHFAIARCIVYEAMKFKSFHQVTEYEIEYGRRSVDILEDKKYIRLQALGDTSIPTFITYVGQRLTKPQRDAIQEWASENGYSAEEVVKQY
jgi:hypothetical protein